MFVLSNYRQENNCTESSQANGCQYTTQSTEMSLSLKRHVSVWDSVTKGLLCPVDVWIGFHSQQTA